ncbi:transcriptional regulator ATRX-like [Macrobrachium nipponense]|uniref:transcriptional regulator ATRX-like n=1 Tax=Macrobrachium nipponense TaxID=159736 RepID=UPI0030C89182
MRRETELIQREREILEIEIQLVKRERELEERAKQLTEVREKSQKKINLREGKHGTHQSLKSKETQFSNTQKKSTTMKANANDIKGKGDLTIKDENSKLWHAATSLDGKGKEEDVFTKEKLNISKRQCSLNIGKGNERETANGDGEMDNRTLLQEMTGITEETDMINLNISIKQKVKLEKISEERTQKREENDRRFENENITKTKDNDGEKEEIPTSGCIQRVPEKRKEINENKMGIVIKEDEFLDDKDVIQNVDLGEGEIIKRHNREMDIEQKLCSEKENVQVAETDEAKGRVRVQEMDRILGRDLIITEDKDTNFESGEVNNENEDTCKGKKVEDGKSLVESEKETVLYITEIIEEHHLRREDEATGIMETLKLTIKNEATDEEKREEPAYRREVNAVVGQENVTTKQVKQTTDGQEEDVLIRQEEKATVRQEIFINGQKRESYPKQGEINTEQEKETITGQDGNVIKGQDEEATAEYEGITIAEKEELPTVWQEKAVDRLGDDATTGQKKDAINEQEDGTVYKHEGNVTDTQEEEIAKQEVETVDEDREEACAGHEEAATAGLENITIIGSEKKTSSEQEGTVAEREEVTLSENQFTTFLTGGDAITVQKEELFNGLEETTTPLKREANVGQKERTIVEMQGVTVRKEGSKTTEHGIEPTDGLEETRGWKKDEAEATADQEEKYARQGPSATTSQEDSSDWQKEKTRTGKEETNTGENEKTIEGQMEDTGQEEDAIIREESVEIPEQEENAITGVGKETTFGKRAATAGWEAEGIAGQGEDPITLKKEKAITGQGEYRLTCRGAEETVWQEDGITLQKEKAIAGQEDHRFTCRGEETAWQEEDAITFQRAKAIAGQGDHWFTCRRKEETTGQEEDAITLQKEKSTAGQGEPRVTCRGEEETASQEEDAITLKKEKAVTGQGEYSMFTWRNEEENAGQEGHTITTREEDAIAAPDEATTGQEQNLFIRQEAEAPAEQKGTPYGQADTTNIWEEEASARKEAVTKKEEYLVIEQEEAKPIWLKEEATTGQVKNKSMIPEDEAITKQEKATTGQEDVFIELEKEATTELQKEIISGREYSTAWHKEKVLTTLNEKNITGQVENATVSQEDKLTIVQIETGGKLEEAGKEVTVGQEADTVNEHIKANNQERNSLMTGVVSKTETTNMKGKLTEKQTKLVEKLAEDFYPDMRQQEMNSTVEPSDTEYETAYECQNKCNNTPQENERHMHYINAQLQKQHTKKAETKPANKRDRRSSCRARNVTDDVCKSTSDEGDCKNSIREQSIKEVTNAESNNVNKDGKSKTVSGRTDKDLFNKTYKECNDYSGSKCSSGEKRFCVNCGSSLEEEKSDENSESSIKIEIDGNNENSPADETSDENSAEDERSDENSPADETSDKNSSEDEISDENSSEDETSDENSTEDETSHENNENSEIIESSTEEAVDGHHESSNEQETDVGEEIVKEKYGVIVDNEGEVEKRRNKRARETRRTNTSSKRTGDDNLQDTSSEADFNASSHRRALTTTELGPSGAEAGGNTMKQDQNRKSTKPRGSPAQPTTPAEMAPRNPSSSDGRGSGEIPCTTEKGKRRTDFEAKETKNSAKNERGNVTRDERDERSRTSRDCHDRSPVKEEDSTRPINNTKGSGQRQKHKNNGDISVKDKSTKRMKGRKKCTQDNKENAKEVPEQEDVNNRWLCTMS